MHQELLVLDEITLNFTRQGLMILNIAVGFIMFGVALNIKKEQFVDILQQPKIVLVGLLAQYILLPIFTVLLCLVLKSYITPSIAFGMILIAACPGGNISNFMSSLAKANIALSVMLTAIGTLSAIFMTPLNFSLYGNLYASTSPLLRPINIDTWEMLKTVTILLGIPVMVGMWFNSRFPKLTDKIKNPIKLLSIAVFGIMVIIAFSNNVDYFLKYIKWIFLIVLLHNFVALFMGYFVSRAFGLTKKNSRTISIEVGIQNSGLALILIFNPSIFPPELKMGGMAFIAGWWGIWHIVAGLTMSYTWGHLIPLKEDV